MAFAYSFSLPNNKLAPFLHSLESFFEQAILESVVDICFVSVACPPDEFHFDDGFNPQKWEQGRAFGEQMELRWRRRKNGFAVLLISESRPSLSDENPLPEPIELSRADTQPPLKVMLWGEWQDAHEETELEHQEYQGREWWYEERIPKFLGYPWGTREERLGIEIARYRESSQLGKDDFPGDFIYRFIRLVPFPIPKNPSPPEGESEEAESDD